MEIQARKGYYAPQYGTDPAEQAREQIEESFFSRDEVHDLPAILQTQFFKDDKKGGGSAFDHREDRRPKAAAFDKMQAATMTILTVSRLGYSTTTEIMSPEFRRSCR